MATRLGCIADDFTGATDLAALLARSGVRVSLRIGLPADPPDDEAAPVEVIALKCRTAPVPEAVAEARAALGWLRSAGAARVFWKYCSTFDSTSEGNIGPVAEALMADLGADQTVYCPAFPENGRTVFMGTLFVGQQPLAESPMKDHPLTPMRDSNLVRLLAPQVRGRVGLADRPTVARGEAALRARLEALVAEGVAHVIVDAVCDEDLETIARTCRDLPLLTGGSALARPLPSLWIADGTMAGGQTAPPPAIGAAAIVLSGSCSAMTNRQVRAFDAGDNAFRLDPVVLAEEGTRGARDWLMRQPPGRTPMIYATAAPDDVRRAQARLGAAAAGEIVERALAELARAALEKGIRRFVVAGGETSGAVAGALGVRRLEIGPEIAPGVPWCFARSGADPIAITLKSGNFGSESFFSDALHLLEAT